MTCRDVAPLLMPYFDGELGGSEAESVAQHAAHCAHCGAELKEFEQIHRVLQQAVAAKVDALDLSRLWPSIDRQLRPPVKVREVRRSWRDAWQEFAAGWQLGAPVLAAAAVVALAYMFVLRSEPSTAPDASRVAVVDPIEAVVPGIEDLKTSYGSVAVFHDPDTSSTLLWVSDSAPATEDFE